MDLYMMASIVIMLGVIAAIVAVVWRYQRIRKKTGYNTGKFFTYKQQMGAYIGNDHFDRIGVNNKNTDDKDENDNEIYILSDTEKSEKE